MEDLPPEDDEGNVEYKIAVLGDAARRERLKTQMSWRLYAGKGDAVYYVGVMDDGRAVGVTAEVLERSIAALTAIAEAIDATVTSTERTAATGRHSVRRALADIAPADGERWVARLTVRRDVNPTPALYLGDD